MNKILKNSIFISFLTVVFFSSCDTGTNPEDLVKLSGFVYTYDADENIVPVENALVTATKIFLQTLTDQNGEFSFEFEPGNDTANVSLKITKVGYQTSTVSISTKKGQDFTVPAVELKKSSNDSIGVIINPSGDAAHIEVVAPHDDHIYVYSSGLTETALIGFKVTDSEGIPVDAEHAETVHFNILHGPDGGEYLYPLEAITVDGYVYTTLNSGTIAGPVQIEAYINQGSKIVRATPARIAVFGGLPDDEHFSVAVEKVNIAGQVHFGLLDNVTAFVGDKYSNPVAPGTIVYFSTEYGIIEGSAVTDELGRATVRYLSSAPLPPNPAQSSFTNITAWTYGDTLTNLTLSTNTNLLLSSVTGAIQVDSASFQYNNSNTPKSFNFIVNDIYGNPVVSGTEISIQASSGDLLGDINFSTLDTRYPGPGSTDFSFTWVPGDSLKDPQVNISISVMTPPDGNGYQSARIVGTKVPD